MFLTLEIGRFIAFPPPQFSKLLTMTSCAVDLARGDVVNEQMQILRVLLHIARPHLITGKFFIYLFIFNLQVPPGWIHEINHHFKHE